MAAAGEVNLLSGHEGVGVIKKPKGEAASAVEAVGDDVLGDIFLRLTDTASLCRAALACKRWRRVASDRVLLRRFHSLHGPPLVGVILSDGGDVPVPYRCPNLRFSPVRSDNPHLAAAAKTGDFFFNEIPVPEHHFDSDEEEGNGIRRDPWMLRGCDGGLLLLSRGRFQWEHLAVYDPFARTAVFFRAPGGFSWVLHYALLANDSDADADASFQVVAVQFFNDRVEAAVFSSRTQDWSPLPSHSARRPWNARDGVRAGRFAYWQSNNLKYNNNDKERVLVLDTISMEWSLIQVPFPVGEPYCATDMAEYGGLCLVVSKMSRLQLWVSIDGRWTMMKNVALRKQFPVLMFTKMKGLRPLAVRDDLLFMEFWTFKPRHYLLLLNLKTMKLEMVKNDSSEPYRGHANNRGSVFPFFMSWAPPLLSPPGI